MKRYPCPCGCDMFYVFSKTYVYTEHFGVRMSDLIPHSDLAEVSDKYLKQLYKRYLKETTIINFKGDI